MEGEERGLSTCVVHGGGGGDPHEALHTLLYDHTTFGFADTASAMARWLADHPRVQRVHHPSLHEGPAGDLVARQMDGPGGMIRLACGLEDVKDLVADLDQALARS